MRRLKERVAALSRSRHAHAAMLGVAVVDGSIFPVPPFAILIPMVLAEPRKWARYATTGTIASLIGGLIGYGIGHLAMLGLAGFSVSTEMPIVFEPLGIETTLREALTKNFWMLALLCSILPTPYKVVAIGSGLVGVGLEAFVLASILGRTARFFGVSGAFALFGEGARRFIKI
ncbi:MAG: DedA family protein [Pseudomonadota bacterium]|nr:MAG: DedA family protein [Pseudomonadota bacterium]